MQADLAAIEPELIAAARHAGVNWQTLAPALGVASRQAAERRFLRPAATAGGVHATGDQRVRAVRDYRAGTRAIARWANANTADLRRLAGQITALTGFDPSAAGAITRLHDALGAPDAAALPARLADTRAHLEGHPQLASQVDAVIAHTEQLRHHTQHHRDTSPPASRPTEPR